ncbi:54S ribosomal protein L10, mitochondrial [Sphaceloma murrayae]|uniref:54S ribosomal protein L10, mitochondrial n=1 Tax=Sphaceloma murrayae TaxID=2082308 RepID=A0A2K1QW68_9PEZI|nr:54S ribosomal protein L10, mitochondrial [Sphaceloma murrayae]
MATLRRAVVIVPSSSSITHHTSTAALLSPFLSRFQQCRQASILSSLSDNRSAYNKRIRRGRGPASGKGKTSGRGHKGQGQHGKVPFGFQGGQTPLEVVHGTRGFENPLAKDLAPLNLSRLQHWISTGRLDPSVPITIKSLVSTRCLSRAKDGVKLLARTDAVDAPPLTVPIQIVVSRASSAAIAAVEKAGGQVLTRYYSKSSLGRILRGEAHPYFSSQSEPLMEVEGVRHEEKEVEDVRRATQRYKYKLADPAGRRDIEYYRDERRRGYLAHTVPEGEGPSLYFKVPGKKSGEKSKKKSKGAAKASDRLW